MTINKYQNLTIKYIRCGNRILVIGWTCPSLGFGEISIVPKKQGLEIDSENMSGHFVSRVLCKALMYNGDVELI